jgi:hypothetical protein
MTEQKTITMNLPAASDMMSEGEVARTDAMLTVIADQEGLAAANATVATMTKRIKELEAARKKITQPLDAAKKAVMDLFRPAVTGYQDAIVQIKGSMSAYIRAEEIKAAKARAEAEAKAAAERKALEEQAAKAESVEEKAALQEAAAMMAAEPVPVQAAPTKAAGVTTRKVWRGHIVNKQVLLAFIAQHPEYLDLVEIKQGALDRMILAAGGTLCFPGVENIEETTVVSR